jgi:hypothetical protein
MANIFLPEHFWSCLMYLTKTSASWFYYGTQLKSNVVLVLLYCLRRQWEMFLTLLQALLKTQSFCESNGADWMLLTRCIMTRWRESLLLLAYSYSYSYSYSFTVLLFYRFVSTRDFLRNFYLNQCPSDSLTPSLLEILQECRVKLFASPKNHKPKPMKWNFARLPCLLLYL